MFWACEKNITFLFIDLDSLKPESSGFSENSEFQRLRLLPVVKKDDFTTRNCQVGGSESDLTVLSSVGVGLLRRLGLTKMYAVAENTAKTWFHSRFPHCSKCEGKGNRTFSLLHL